MPDIIGIKIIYNTIVTQAIQYNICIRPSKDIMRTSGVVPDNMLPVSEWIVDIALYSKFCMNNVINSSYKDALNLLMTTTNGLIFLKIIQQQVHPSLKIDTIVTIDIPKYSDFNSLFRYAREVTVYI